MNTMEHEMRSGRIAMVYHWCRPMLPGMAALLVWTGVQLGSLEVSAQPILSPHGCRTRVGRRHKRHRCLACVRRAGMVFHKQGAAAGFCRPKAVHRSGIIRAEPGCVARIGRLTKRHRCVACVRRGGVFHKRGATAGYCRGGKAPAPVVGMIRAEAGCISRIGRLPKRQRCIACVHRGGVFHKQGGSRGFCKGGAALNQIRTGPGCAARIGRVPKRQRCMVCVRRGGVFHKQGAAAGFCKGGAPLPPAGVVIATRPGCVTHIGRIAKRRRCKACVRKGGVFHRQGGGAGFCRGRAVAPHPRAAGPIRAAPGCVARIGRITKRQRCIACVHRGGVFHKRGGSRGFCAGPVAPTPAPAFIRSVHGCRTRIGRVSKRRRCIACVRRGGRFLKQGAAHGLCR